MFTKMKRGGFFRVHPVCSMLAGALVTIGIGTLLVTKRRALADALESVIRLYLEGEGKRP